MSKIEISESSRNSYFFLLLVAIFYGVLMTIFWPNKIYMGLMTCIFFGVSSIIGVVIIRLQRPLLITGENSIYVSGFWYDRNSIQSITTDYRGWNSDSPRNLIIMLKSKERLVVSLFHVNENPFVVVGKLNS